MKRLLLLVCVSLTGFALISPGPASGATCADYDNQAEAQKNKDTRDADGDGIYCEALPCPCSNGKGKKKSGGGKKKANKKKKKKKAKPIYTYRGYVTDVVDGDTIKVELDTGRTITVRQIGIEAPEPATAANPIECGALEAKAVALLWSFSGVSDTNGDGLYDSGTGGRRVRLVTDNRLPKTDARRRLLAYVYGADGSSLQRAVLKAGWADTYLYRNLEFKKWSVYENDLETARLAQVGVFDLCGGDFNSPK